MLHPKPEIERQLPTVALFKLSSGFSGFLSTITTTLVDEAALAQPLLLCFFAPLLLCPSCSHTGNDNVTLHYDFGQKLWIDGRPPIRRRGFRGPAHWRRAIGMRTRVL